MKITFRLKYVVMILCKTRESTGFLLFQRLCADFRIVWEIFVDTVVEHDAVEVVDFMLQYYTEHAVRLQFELFAVDCRRRDADRLVRVAEPFDIIAAHV